MRVYLWILIGLIAVFLLTAAGLAVFGYWYPYFRAANTMPEDGICSAALQEDGSLLLLWTQADQADYYMVDILSYDPTAPQTEDEEEIFLYRTTSEENSCTVPDLGDTGYVRLRISSVVAYSTISEDRERMCTAPMEMTVNLKVPAISNLSYTLNEDTGRLNVTFDMTEGDTCAVQLYEGDEEFQSLTVLDEGSYSLTFGDGADADLPLPQRAADYLLTFRVTRAQGNFLFTGSISGSIDICREDLLGRGLNVQCEDLGDNVYSLSWQETKGDHYEVQMYDSDYDTWDTVGTISQEEERTYSTGHLGAFSEFSFRVVAVGGEVETGSPYAAVSEEVVCTTSASTIFCTIWPVSNLTAYSDADKTSQVGTVTALTAYTVVDSSNGMFGIMVDGQECYIDSTYCMINLPEYLGELCEYDITNSYSSLYMVHEYEIPEMTGTLVTGYEHVKLADGTYLAPLLYPTAGKLLVAAETALEQGYRIKIYDSYRPNKTTIYIYDQANRYLNESLPSETFTGVDPATLDLPSQSTITVPITDLDQYEGYQLVDEDGNPITLDDLILEEEPAGGQSQSADDAGDAQETQSPEDSGEMGDAEETGSEAEGSGEGTNTDADASADEDTTQTEESTPSVQMVNLLVPLTYRSVMLGSSGYTLNAFLAHGRSMHNLGIAMDLTLVDISTGTEISAQTRIHDLSWYSILSKNNSIANTLSAIMLSAGFTGLSSEWWHFQDNEARDTLGLPTMVDGVSVKGWSIDDGGWKYRLDDGTCYTSCTMDIDGTTYSFDDTGHLIVPGSEDASAEETVTDVEETASPEETPEG